MLKIVKKDLAKSQITNSDRYQLSININNIMHWQQASNKCYKCLTIYFPCNGHHDVILTLMSSSLTVFHICISHVFNGLCKALGFCCNIFCCYLFIPFFLERFIWNSFNSRKRQHKFFSCVYIQHS